MVVDIVRDLAQQNAFRTEDPESFPAERRVKVGEVIALLPGRSHAESEASGEVFLLVPSLIWNMRRVVYDYLKSAVLERHRCIVADNGRAMRGLYVQANNFAVGPSPDAAPVYSGVEDQGGRRLWIEGQHAFQ